MHTEIRSAFWPLLGTLVGVALELGNYESRALANVVWVGCALLWLAWVWTVSPWRHVSPERQEFRKQLKHYDTLGKLIVEGEHLEMRITAHDFTWGDISRYWVEKCFQFLRNHYSTSEATKFYQTTHKSGDVTKHDGNISERIAYLKSLRASLADKLRSITIWS